jgi:mycothiol synthase
MKAQAQSSREVFPRPYQDEHDIEEMRAVLVAGRQAKTPTYYVHVGDLNWWLFYLNQSDKRQETIFLWQEDERIIGWSLLSPRFQAFDIFVRPDLSTESLLYMTEWTEQRLVDVLGQSVGNIYTIWIAEDDAARIHLLKSRGFRQEASYLQLMQIDLNASLPAPALPPGYAVHPVTREEEAEKRAAVAHAAFVSSKVLDEYVQDYRHFIQSAAYPNGWDIVVTAPTGQFAAFCLCWLDHVNKAGYLEPMGTHPDFRQQGLGKAVILAALGRMQQAGMESASVCVEPDNHAAQRLYTSAGFQSVKVLCSFVKAGNTVG